MVTKKVLIADDSEINREMITEILGDGYSYIYASDGDELIDMLGSGCQADIILLDINMPHMDGFEVLGIMNERRWIEETPVVVISAESDLGFLERADNLDRLYFAPVLGCDYSFPGGEHADALFKAASACPPCRRSGA